MSSDIVLKVKKVCLQTSDWDCACALVIHDNDAFQGHSEDEALDNLREALELYFEPLVATVTPTLHKLEVEVRAA